MRVGRYLVCDTCGAPGHSASSPLCPYKKTQERQDPYGLERRKRERPRAQQLPPEGAVLISGPGRV